MATNEKIAEKVMGTYRKIEDTVVGGYTKIEDAFVDRYLTKDGETVEEAKKRLKQETAQTEYFIRPLGRAQNGASAERSTEALRCFIPLTVVQLERWAAAGSFDTAWPRRTSPRPGRRCCRTAGSWSWACPRPSSPLGIKEPPLVKAGQLNLVVRTT